MTREEAIERLKTDIYKYADFTENPNENEFWMAFDMAIESLGQEPCEDCISRQAVLKAIDVKAWEFCDYLIRNGRNDEQKPVSHFADNLREYVGEDLPSVTPQPKTGHWKKIATYPLYECSKCKLESMLNTWDYCPNCGCRMVEPQESGE